MPAAISVFTALAKPALTGQKNRWEETPAERRLSIKGKAYIAGIYEHPTRHAPDKSTPQLHAEVAKGAIEDAGLTRADIDGYFCAGDAPGGVMAMVDYLGLKVRHFDSTDTGGCSYLVFYEVKDDEVVIVGVRHGARDPGSMPGEGGAE